MATVKIGGRDLDVRPATLGFRKHRLLPWRARLAGAATEAEAIDLHVEGLLLYVGHNEGVDAAWLLENTPDDNGATLRACAEAAGQKMAAPGEAQSP